MSVPSPTDEAPGEPPAEARFDEEALNELRRRMGDETVRERLLRQANLWAGLSHQGEGVLWIERYLDIDVVIKALLVCSGTFWWGRRNFLDVRLVEREAFFQRLPMALDGLRLLHLTDLHLDLDTALTPRILEVLEGVEFDLAVITGDFRNAVDADHAEAMREARKVINALQGRNSQNIYAILGNHDSLEMVPHLEQAGLRVLLNEGERLFFPERGEQASLFLGGIDDPHFFQTHDLGAALAERKSADLFTILLAHSPEIYREAAALGVDFMLSGHTHGGQMCLPGGFAVIRNGRCPERMIKGGWTHGNLVGYTGPGTGACGVNARFFCPPEVTVHVLRRASEASAARVDRRERSADWDPPAATAVGA
jgi:hypothetical protein